MNDLIKTDTITRRYYTIPMIARKLKVADSKIRFWSEQLGIEPIGKKHHKRKFTVEQLVVFELVKSLSDTGMYTLNGIKFKIGL